MTSNTAVKNDTASFDEFAELERKTTCDKINTLHDELREALIGAMKVSGDYSYPETEDGYVSGVFTEEPDWQALASLCKYVANKGDTRYDGGWSEKQLYSFVRKDIHNYHNGDMYRVPLSFGGLCPILALLPFLAVYSTIYSLDVVFTHDKWEVRGDYSAESHVGVKLRKKKLIVGKFRDDEDDHEDMVDDEWKQKKKEAHAKEWLLKYCDLVTKEPLIYFDGAVFAFTGLEVLDERNHPVVVECIKRGGIFREKVSRNTHYLVVDPAGAGESKIKHVQGLREMGYFVDVILQKDLEEAIREERSEAQETEIKEKFLERRERETAICKQLKEASKRR